MKNTYKLLLGLFVVLFVSCEDPDEGPVFYYEDLEGGTYIRLVENSGNFLVDLNDVGAFTHSYTVEFVDADNGTTVSSYTADLVYTPKGGTAVTAADFVNVSSFTTTDAGYAGATISFTSAELLSAVGITAADLGAEDVFELQGEIVTPTNTYNSVNSSATVEGAFFQGYFDFDVYVGCPSSIAGDDYVATTTAINCSTGTPGSTSVTYTLEISDEGNPAIGEYSFDDFTFGVLDDCFDDDSVLEGFTFQDVCGTVSFTNTTDAFGLVWDVTSVINGNDWEITWSNPDTGLSGVTAITFPGGVPFTL